MSYSRFIQIPRGSLLSSESQPTQASFPLSLPQLRHWIQLLLWNQRNSRFLQNRLHKANVCVVDFFLRFRALFGYLSCCWHLRGRRLSGSAHSGGGRAVGVVGRGWAWPWKAVGGCGHGPSLRLDATPGQALSLGSLRASFPHPLFISCSPPQDYKPRFLDDSGGGHSGTEDQPGETEP